MANSQEILDTIKNNPGAVMAPAYLQLWNDDVRQQIDADIEKYRKADACIKIDEIPPNTEVRAEQISHEFIFGAHIFNYDQLGSDEANARYKELYGTLFNSAMIAFYWQRFEMERDKPRFVGEYRDSAEFWSTVENPKEQPHWRRPATDPIVEFCEKKGIHLHGHPLVWGSRCWNIPTWIHDNLPAIYRDQIQPRFTLSNERPTTSEENNGVFESLTAPQIEKLLPKYVAERNVLMAKRIAEIALRYKNRIHYWDVVNESTADYAAGALAHGGGICKSHYGLMPGDYPHRALKLADSFFPRDVQLNISDFNLTKDYPRQVAELKSRGCRIDTMCVHFHLFNPQDCLHLANGDLTQLSAKSRKTIPDEMRKTIDLFSHTDTPIHMSEVTITSPNNDERGQLIQAVIAWNLYRLWFSLKPIKGINWWNVVDDCGAPGEPDFSGLFLRNMTPKPAYYVLDDLINHEWKTNLTVRSDDEGKVLFRGFRGKYRLTWKDKSGVQQSAIYEMTGGKNGQPNS